ncbi:hypothetical protein Q5W86_16210 [Shouchella clausii]|nr:hypothetical protein [Shouchella clausii]MDO7269343.1 hypothetical protein [Shouchella clausii]MDO7289225.1 hypothetical protein [Shouchella clausii]
MPSASDGSNPCRYPGVFPVICAPIDFAGKRDRLAGNPDTATKTAGADPIPVVPSPAPYPSDSNGHVASGRYRRA